jgi:hypothetical protein
LIKNVRKSLARAGLVACLGASSLMTSGCSGSGGGYVSPSVHVGVGYRGYYGSPWHARDAYDAAVIDTVDTIDTIDAIDSGMGGYGGGMDMGGFDW